jgi:hypothetical protein
MPNHLVHNVKFNGHHFVHFYFAIDVVYMRKYCDCERTDLGILVNLHILSLTPFGLPSVLSFCMYGYVPR